MHQPTNINDLSRLCIHTQTHKPWNLEQCVKHFHEAGVKGISVWRHLLKDLTLLEVKNLLSEYQMDAVSLVRGGFFPSVDESDRRRAMDDNLLAVEQAEAIGAPLVVLVCGADPRQPLAVSRDQILDGIQQILPTAEEAGIKLAVEPLHPMYAADRSAIITMGQANDMVEEINSDLVGVAVDVFHLWWDPMLQREIERCGNMQKLFAFHVCDWSVPLNDMLNDRGLMGEGCIQLKQIRGWVERGGFEGYIEVEIFSDRYWSMDQKEYLDKIIHAYYNFT
jgi:sugar phosphate isomerase/epimerase